MNVKKLCETCSTLNLSIGKFVLSDDSTLNTLANDGTEFASNDGVTKPIDPYIIDPVGFRPMKLGYLDEIYNRRFSCNLCKLVYEGTYDNGIKHDSLDKDDARVVCSMDWKLDGRMIVRRNALKLCIN